MLRQVVYWHNGRGYAHTMPIAVVKPYTFQYQRDFFWRRDYFGVIHISVSKYALEIAPINPAWKVS
jgi:hypothetical protein